MSWLRGCRRWCWRRWLRWLPPCLCAPHLHLPPMPFSIEEEVAVLEDYKKYLEDEKASIEEEIKVVEARMRELRSLLEGKKKQEN